MKTRPYDLAFPIEERTRGDMPEGNYLHAGMYKREEIAARIMASMCSNKLFEDYAWSTIADMAINATDALINALNKPSNYDPSPKN